MAIKGLILYENRINPCYKLTYIGWFESLKDQLEDQGALVKLALEIRTYKSSVGENLSLGP